MASKKIPRKSQNHVVAKKQQPAPTLGPSEGTRGSARNRKPGVKGPHQNPVQAYCPEQRMRMISEAAYHRAERRAFVPGGELDDWLAAEAEVDAFLAEHTM